MWKFLFNPPLKTTSITKELQAKAGCARLGWYFDSADSGSWYFQALLVWLDFIITLRRKQVFSALTPPGRESLLGLVEKWNISFPLIWLIPADS